MNHKEIIQKTEKFINSEFRTEGSGHDWFHVDRVRKMAIRIGKQEGCDLFVTEMAALLHDLDDWKLNRSEVGIGSRAEEWLAGLELESGLTGTILGVIEEVSFKGAGIRTPVSSAEAAVVQDADRLDAMGAIGIARTFAYGGHKSRLIYDPLVTPVLHDNFRSYQESTAPTVNHFYEKLLLLKDRMNTDTARSIAAGRHRFMEKYLRQFYDEWDAVK